MSFAHNIHIRIHSSEKLFATLWTNSEQLGDFKDCIWCLFLSLPFSGYLCLLVSAIGLTWLSIAFSWCLCCHGLYWLARYFQHLNWLSICVSGLRWVHCQSQWYSVTVGCWRWLSVIFTWFYWLQVALSSCQCSQWSQWLSRRKTIYLKFGYFKASIPCQFLSVAVSVSVAFISFWWHSVTVSGCQWMSVVISGF